MSCNPATKAREWMWRNVQGFGELTASWVSGVSIEYQTVESQPKATPRTDEMLHTTHANKYATPSVTTPTLHAEKRIYHDVLRWSLGKACGEEEWATHISNHVYYGIHFRGSNVDCTEERLMFRWRLSVRHCYLGLCSRAHRV